MLAVAGSVAAAAPAGAAEPASATPIHDTLETTTAAAVPADVRSAVEQTAAPIAEPLRSSVDTIAAAKPVGAVMDTLRGSVERVGSPLRPAVAAVVDRSSSPAGAVSQATRSPAGATSALRGSGRIDRDASTRRGTDASGGSLAADVLEAASTPLQAGLAAVAEQARASASSTFATGGDEDDPLDGLPLGPGDGTSLLAGPAGIALLALGLLIAMLTVIPRFCSELLPTPPARWGLAAFRLPIERPG